MFRTNSDEPSVILILANKVVYATSGVYGGYLLKPREVGVSPGEFTSDFVESLVSSARAFYVEPHIENITSLPRIYYEEDWDKLRQKVEEVSDERIREALKELLEGRLPRDVVKKLCGGYVERITYRYTEVSVIIKKVKEGAYAVLDFEPKPDGLRLQALALRIYHYYGGSRRHPTLGQAQRDAKMFRLKYPDNELIQRCLYGKDTTDRGSALFLKVVLEAPQELAPQPQSQAQPQVAPATQATQPQQAQQPQAVLVNGFLVLSRLPSKALLDAHLPELFKGTRVGTKQIKLAMGYFYNKLGSLSRKFYVQILPRHAINAGFAYIVPRERVAAFLRDIDQLKREYEEFEQQLKDFLLYGRVPEEVERNKRAKVYTEYLDIIREYLRQHGREELIRERVESLDIAGRVQVRLIPFAVDMSLLYEYADEQVRRRLEEEIEALRRDIAEATKAKIRERAREIIKRLEAIARAKAAEELLKRVREEVEELEKMARSLGVESEELAALKELIATEDLQKLVVEAAEGRLKALLQF